MDLTLTTAVTEDGRHTITLAGAIDLESRTELINAGREALEAPGATGLVLNLADITFIDSTGIGAIVSLASDASDAEASFALQEPSARVTRILELTGLGDAWTIEPEDPS